VLLVECALLAGARAQDNASAQYVGKVLVQRQFVTGAHPVYEADGKILSGTTGPWTTSAKIEVSAIRVDVEKLFIEGRRLFLLFDTANRQFRDVFDVMENPADAPRLIPVLPQGKQLEDLRAQQHVSIEVRRSGGWDDAAVAVAIKRVFLSHEESLADVVPDLWKDWLCRMEMQAGRMVPCMTPANGPAGPLYKVGAGVTAPRVIAAPDPEYAETARRARYQGTCVLWLRVGREGRVESIRLARPIGLGLDEKAAEAVTGWLFQPATKDGQPVPVQINLEVNFRLY